MARTCSSRPLAIVVIVAACASACTADQSSEPDEQDGDVPLIINEPTQTVPRTPFCLAMTQLADRLETDNSTPAAPLILETYRGALADAPAVLVDDMRVVIDALENDRPIPTDPAVTFEDLPEPDTTPPLTTPTTPTTPEAETSTVTTATTPAAPDLGFNEATSPTERIASYVGFECRGTDNNPGPPATQPLSEPASDE